MDTPTLGRLRRSVLVAMLSVIIVGSSLLVNDSALATIRRHTSTTSSTTAPTTTSTTAKTTTSTSIPSSTSTTVTVPSTSSTLPNQASLPWPAYGSAAVAIPQLSVAAASPDQPRVPIASLTKMMTAWVVLQRRPLSFTQQGPCLVVNAHDVALWKYDLATGQSNAAIALGETLCEGTLLRGLLVHSAGNYAQLLARLVGLGEQKFVALMNHDATMLGLRHTHYVDYSGIGAGNISTASDQALMAIDLMNAQPIVRQIATMPSVWLPVAGVVSSYTPDIGQFGVVGVKSGYTPQAGGCDVMAVNVTINKASYVTYAVVLGQSSSDPLGLAGQLALALSRKLRSYMKVVATPTGRAVEWRGPASDVIPGPVTTSTTLPKSTTTTTTVSPTTTIPLT